MLKDHADRAAHSTQILLIQSGDVDTINQDAAGTWLLQPVDEADQRGFAGT